MLADVLRMLGTPASGYVAEKEMPSLQTQPKLDYLGDDAALMAQGPNGNILVNAVGGVDVTSNRADVYDRFSRLGFSFVSVVHPSAVVAQDVLTGEGAQIMAGAVVQPGAKIGRNAIINTRAVVDHDTQIANHVHVATGVVIAGGVTIGEASHIGAGAVVIQNVTIGRKVLVAAGAVVVLDLADGVTVAGIPARPMFNRS